MLAVGLRRDDVGVRDRNRSISVILPNVDRL